MGCKKPMFKKKYIKFIKKIIFIIIAIVVFYQYCILNKDIDITSPIIETWHESDYVNAYCKGTVEYVLPDKTRIDCLTQTEACEFDWAKKWYEGIGQALWYAQSTGKKPCLALIINSQEDYKYFNRAKILCDKYNINLIEIKGQRLNK